MATFSGSLSITYCGSSYTNITGIWAESTVLDISFSNLGDIGAVRCTGNITNNSVEYNISFSYCNSMLIENNVFKSMISSFESNNITFKRNLFLGDNFQGTYTPSRVLELSSDTSVIIINNTFSEFDLAAGNSESEPSRIIGISDYGTSLNIDIRNNIFWNISDPINAYVISNQSNIDIIIEYNNIQGGYDEIYGSFSLGPGNINEDPLFTDSENGDYTLQLGSPCIDTGDPDSPLDSDGTRADMGAGAFYLSNILDTEIPLKFTLHHNYPNPFNPTTTLRYNLPEDALVNITIYDMMGRVVKTMVNSQQNAGFKSVRWNATNDAGSPVSAGLYLYMIQAGEFRQTKKMLLLK